MRPRNYLYLVTSLLISVAGLMALLLMLGGLPAEASPAATVHYVAPNGNCGGLSPCYGSVQAAANAAQAGDTIKIASGTYTSTGSYVVSITKGISLIGGYLPSDWNLSVPSSRATVIDGEDAPGRRGIYVGGTEGGTLTLSGLTIQGGSAANSNGGGIYVLNGTMVLQDSRVMSNTASGNLSKGGAIYVTGGLLTIRNTTFVNNSANRGGGLYSYNASMVVEDSTFERNQADPNTSLNFGGAIYVEGGSLSLSRSALLRNTASRGGALYIDNGSAGLDSNLIFGNSTTQRAGAIYVVISSGVNTVTGVNDIIAGNPSPSEGVYILMGSLAAKHWTLADNGDYAIKSSGLTVLTNTIAASHAVAAFSGNVHADHTLFFNSGAEPCNTPEFCTNNFEGDPKFLDPAAGEYHLGRGSAAADKGIYAGVAVDLDGEDRPVNAGYDLGADEVPLEPTASFSAPDAGWAGNDINFTNTSNAIGNVSYVWDFGDGKSSSEVHPTHVYTAPGTYNVVLTANLRPWVSTYEEQIVIDAARFSSNSPHWDGETTVFTNMTMSHSPATYVWDFGDGNSSTDEHPTHLYGGPGDYEVRLTATNSTGSGFVTHTVTVWGPPTALFTTSSPDWLGQDSIFTDMSDGHPTSYQWDFGDGNSSTLASPSHQYSAPGYYTVTLTAINQEGEDTITDTITVFSQPSVNFTGSPLEGVRPLHVSFNGTAETDPPGDSTLTYLWDFGDGGTSTLINPEHTYTAFGEYTVTLEVSNAAGTGSKSLASYVKADPIPVDAGFYGTPTSRPFPFTVAFTNTSTGDYATSLWDFGDGGSSDLTHPSHQYSAKGTYTVTLLINGPGGTETITRPHYITAFAPAQAAFDADPRVGIAPLSVAFTNTSTGDYSSSLWQFGDGAFSTQNSPDYVYSQSGIYTVTLRVSGDGGVSTHAAKQYITVYAPVHANFTATPTSGNAPLNVTFSNTSQGDYSSLMWDFGDGQSSAVASPSHTYQAEGTYTVTLTASGLGGMDQEIKRSYIMVGSKGVYLPVIRGRVR